jgi:ParB/RepB/Spo0J family partition protein
MVKVKKAPVATEPDVLPAPTPAPLQEEAALPWLDCDGTELHEGDKATVLPDVSKRLSGKLVKVLGEYDPQKKSVQVEPLGWEGEDFGILLCFLKRLPVVGESVMPTVTVSPGAQEVLETIMLVGGETRPHDFQSAASLLSIAELVAAGLIEQIGSEEPATYRATAAGIAACPEEDLAAVEAFDPYKLPHFTEVRAKQDQERAARRQEPVAPFEVTGQAAHEAAQVAAPEPHRVGWAHKDGSQVNHHYDAQGATACGYKRKAGALHFAEKPADLPRWQACEKCDAVFVRGPKADAVEETAAPAPITAADIKEAVSTPTATTAPVYTHTTMKLVPLADIVVTSNTRKVFDETALAELAESIKAQGVIAPITVRPHAGQPGKFELVAGERRYRASKLAEKATIPAVIRTLTDREFLEVQLLENLQRVDVRPADEASAFSKLLGSNFSAEEIAQRVGKPVKFVLQRAKLVALIPFWFDLLESEKLALVAAHDLARLPAHSQLVVKHAVEKRPDYYTKGYSKTDIRNIIEEKVTRDLAKARWSLDDATLVSSAGPCTTCPKRSTAQGLLFEQSGPALCLDSSCFASKRAAMVGQRFDELTKELGKAPLQVTTNYLLGDNQRDAGIIPSRDYYSSQEGASGAVAALVVDGSDAGQIKYVRLTDMAAMKEGRAHATDAQKAEDAARIRKDRTKKMHRTLLAERLTVDLPASIAEEGSVAHGALDYFIMDELNGKAAGKLEYLKEAFAWEPTAEALKDDWNTYDSLGFRPWKSWLLGKLDELGFVEKLNLFFILKVRHRMDHEYEDLQFDIAKLIGETYDGVKAEAKQAVEARYYSKGKKQEATA